ncbi:MAG: ImmA/IrrE family metallo-endopeptidase [Deltaproteobacteria bacterium]|nr:ImmA/IrrE family metallo-endopeptidase [Deltaproteobacteria bacterium]
MATQVIAGNLLRLRKEKGLTQAALADSAGLSRPGYQALEQGRSEPQVATLQGLARALGVPLKDLVTPVQGLQHVRFRSLKRLKRRSDILHRTAKWLRDFNELEELLGVKDGRGFDQLAEATRSAAAQDLGSAAAAARDYVGLTSREPVHDICGLLESQGIKVLQVEVASDAFLGLSVARESGGPAVVVNTWDRLAVEHWIFSAAHELGHLLLHLDAYDVGLQKEDEDQERAANVFASHFLMPEDAFRREWSETAGLPLLDRLVKVKRVFRVSWRTVAYRVGEGLTPEARNRLWTRANWEHRIRYGGPLLKNEEPEGIAEHAFRDPRAPKAESGEPAELDAHDFQADLLARLVRRAIEGEEITLSRGAEILGLSIDAMRDRSASWIV